MRENGLSASDLLGENLGHTSPPFSGGALFVEAGLEVFLFIVMGRC
jgi:hypothetical protein